MMLMYALTIARTTTKRDFFSNATIIPNGNAPKSVRAKMPIVRNMPIDMVESIVSNDIAVAPC